MPDKPDKESTNPDTDRLSVRLVQYGWICQRCGASLSPTMSICPCSPSQYGAPYGIPPIMCGTVGGVQG